MLQNDYLVAKIGVDTAENYQDLQDFHNSVPLETQKIYKISSISSRPAALRPTARGYRRRSFRSDDDAPT